MTPSDLNADEECTDGLERADPGQRDLDLAEDLVRLAGVFATHMHLFDMAWLRAHMARRGHRVVVGAYDAAPSASIYEALKTRRPYSVIRLGDGEANLLYYGDAGSNTPRLDRWAAAAIVSMQSDRFAPLPASLTAVRNAIQHAVQGADIVGISGLSRPSGAEPAADEQVARLLQALRSDPRGLSGQLRVRMLGAAMPDDLPLSTLFASSHLYAGLIPNLATVTAAARRVVCITDAAGAVDVLRAHFPGNPIEVIAVGTHTNASLGSDGLPVFIAEVDEQIENASAGVLYLIGAGPWAEIYCERVKRKGGVGVDLGSGFDLIAGRKTRPVHDSMTLPFG